MDYKDKMLSVYQDEHGYIWQKIGECPFPTNILRNLSTGEIIHIVPDCLNAKKYNKLVKEKE